MGTSVTSRALAILGAFDRGHQALSLSQIARRTGIPPATAHRLLGELQSWGALRRDDDSRYRIGLRLWEVGSLASPLASVRDVAMPYLQRLYEVTREEVHLAVRDGADAVFVEYLGARRHGTDVGHRGLRRPLGESAAGLALLAHQGGPALDPDDRLAEIRRRGLAVLPDPSAPGLRTVAVPVVREDGTAVAAIGLCVRAPEAVQRWWDVLTETASRMQHALGHTERVPYDRAVEGSRVGA
ncbi:IclR family transcriptional regulator [Streptomyces spiralis]